MRKNYFVCLIIIISLIFIINYNVKAAPNPAQMYCINSGYEFEGSDCIFPDGSRCALWHYYRKCSLYLGQEENDCTYPCCWETGKLCPDDLTPYYIVAATIPVLIITYLFYRKRRK